MHSGFFALYCLRHRTPPEVFPVTGLRTGSLSRSGGSESTPEPDSGASSDGEYDPAPLVDPGPGRFDLGQRNRLGDNSEFALGDHLKKRRNGR
jgi:hypothetical protein